MKRYSKVMMTAVLAGSQLCAACNRDQGPGSVLKLGVIEGRPVVDCVFVDGHGPFRFLVDTGANVNLIDSDLARKIGMKATFNVELASSSGKTSLPGSDRIQVTLASIEASEQKFLFTDLGAVHKLDPDVRGVLGQWFLCHFDYLLDLSAKRLEFGKLERNGTRARFAVVNARTVVSTSLGDLVLDSAAARVILFGVESDRSDRSIVKTFTGSQASGTAFRKLVIEGRNVWHGDAVTMPSRTEPGIAGLLPLSLFKAIYVCNSEGYVIFE
jgi:hypothetical protein